MDSRTRNELDRWITGNWGEDSVGPECPEDCDDWQKGNICIHVEPPEDDPDRKRDEASDDDNREGDLT